MEYIRFGEIPANEKSGIYKGEEKIGEELGVSVYSAIHDESGNLCVCIAFPLTRDTLDTFRMLTEYEDRPCYLVEGEFVGRDKDNQPLIRKCKKIARITTKEVKSSYVTATTSSGRTDVMEDGFLEKNGGIRWK